MKMNLYPKLAWHGISKNKKTYVPFLLTSIGLVMMFYIVSYLTYNKSVKQMRGGDDMQMILSWGVPVVAFFVVIFLFYMNSFLMRRRKTEFGLYNILAWEKATSPVFFCGRISCCSLSPQQAVWAWVSCFLSWQNSVRQKCCPIRLLWHLSLNLLRCEIPCF